MILILHLFSLNLHKINLLLVSSHYFYLFDKIYHNHHLPLVLVAGYASELAATELVATHVAVGALRLGLDNGILIVLLALYSF